MQIIPADRRVTDARGVKLLVVGPSGVGKTSLLRMVDLASTLFVNIEAGDLAVQDVPVDTLRPRTWPECRDLSIALACANPAVPAKALHRSAHHPPGISRCETFFIDGIIAGAGCAWASSQQPEPLLASPMAPQSLQPRTPGLQRLLSVTYTR